MTYYDLAKLNQRHYQHPIVLAKLGSQLHELADYVDENYPEMTFLDTSTKIGMRVYQRSLIFMFMCAVNKVLPNNKAEVLFPLGDSVYVECDCQDFSSSIKDIDNEMQRLIKDDCRFIKSVTSLHDALNQFKKNNMPDKEALFSYRRVSSITMYELNGFKDYFYGDLVHSTGILNKYKLVPFKNGILLCFPNMKQPNVVADVGNREKMYNKLYETSLWARSLHAKTIGDLNNAIVNNRMDELILLQEAMMEKNVANIAMDIINQDKKFVLIAGPSSSGKTSFSNRLAIQLKTYGINCHTIACDDYFRNRADIPTDEKGEQNLEAIDVVDLDKFDCDMQELMRGNRIEIPKFNFVSGEREYRGKHFVQLGKNDIVIIEGIHCLNPRFLPSVSPYRVYISALTPLNIDEHTRISSSDLRMLRRMARDNRHRGTNPQNTIKGWGKVRAGEEENIFPYQENADVIFNSSLVYEVPMMKTIVEPLLFSVPKDSDEWIEAKRMLKFLDFFLAYPSTMVPKNSILQEFLGGSCFDVG